MLMVTVDRRDAPHYLLPLALDDPVPDCPGPVSATPVRDHVVELIEEVPGNRHSKPLGSLKRTTTKIVLLIFHS